MYFAEPIDWGPPQAHLLESDDNRLNQRYRYLLIQSQVNQSICQWHIWRCIYYIYIYIYATYDKQDTPKVSALWQYSSRAIWCQHFAVTLAYAILVSPTPLEQLLDSGSLPASKRISGTQARLRIEVYGCLRLCNTGGWVRYFGRSQMAVDLLANG